MALADTYKTGKANSGTYGALQERDVMRAICPESRPS